MVPHRHSYLARPGVGLLLYLRLPGGVGRSASINARVTRSAQLMIAELAESDMDTPDMLPGRVKALAWPAIGQPPTWLFLWLS